MSRRNFLSSWWSGTNSKSTAPPTASTSAVCDVSTHSPQPNESAGTDSLQLQRGVPSGYVLFTLANLKKRLHFGCSLSSIAVMDVDDAAKTSAATRHFRCATVLETIMVLCTEITCDDETAEGWASLVLQCCDLLSEASLAEILPAYAFAARVFSALFRHRRRQPVAGADNCVWTSDEIIAIIRHDDDVAAADVVCLFAEIGPFGALHSDINEWRGPSGEAHILPTPSHLLRVLWTACRPPSKASWETVSSLQTSFYQWLVDTHGRAPAGTLLRVAIEIMRLACSEHPSVAGVLDTDDDDAEEAQLRHNDGPFLEAVLHATEGSDAINHKALMAHWVLHRAVGALDWGLCERAERLADVVIRAATKHSFPELLVEAQCLRVAAVRASQPICCLADGTDDNDATAGALLRSYERERQCILRGCSSDSLTTIVHLRNASRFSKGYVSALLSHQPLGMRQTAVAARILTEVDSMWCQWLHGGEGRSTPTVSHEVDLTTADLIWYRHFRLWWLDAVASVTPLVNSSTETWIEERRKCVATAGNRKTSSLFSLARLGGAWGHLDATCARGALLFRVGRFDAAKQLWAEAYASLAAAIQQSSNTANLSGRRVAARSMARLCLNLSALHASVSDRTAHVEQRRVALATSLKMAYEACAVTARWKEWYQVPADPTASTQRSSEAKAQIEMKSLHFLSCVAVCEVLGRLGQFHKVLLLLDDIDTITAWSTTCDVQNPFLDVSVADIAVMRASALEKTHQLEAAVRAGEAARSIAIRLYEKWRLVDDATMTKTTATALLAHRPHRMSVSDVAQCARDVMPRMAKRVELEVDIIVGNTQMHLGNWDAALASFSNALALAHQHRDSVYEVQCLQSLGRCYHHLGNTTMAVSYMQQATQLAHDIATTTTTLTNSGGVGRHVSVAAGEMLAYRSATTLAEFLMSVGRHEEAAQVWEKVLALAKKYADADAERAAMRNVLVSLFRNERFHEAAAVAEELECVCQKLKPVPWRDVRFALRFLAESLLGVGDATRAVQVIDRLDGIEDGTTESHNISNELRAKAFLLTKNDAGALDTLYSWQQRAASCGDTAEELKATIALMDALRPVSLWDAKEAAFRALHLAQTLHQTQTDLSGEQKNMLHVAVSWLVGSYYLSREGLVQISPCVADAVQTLAADFPQLDDEQPRSDGPMEQTDDTNSAYLSGDSAEDEDVDSEGGDACSHWARSYDPVKAMDVIELSSRLLLGNGQPRGTDFALHFSGPLRMSPSDAVYRCFAQSPQSTFVVFFSDATSGCLRCMVKPSATASIGVYTFDIPSHVQTVAAYHGLWKRPSSVPSAHRAVRPRQPPVTTNEAPPDDAGLVAQLFVSLRTLHDTFFESICGPSAAMKRCFSRSFGPIVIVPSPDLMHLPFASFISAKRKALGQRAPIVVSPSFEHYWWAKYGSTTPLNPTSHGQELKVHVFVSHCVNGALDAATICENVFSLEIHEGSTRRELFAALVDPNALCVIVYGEVPPSAFFCRMADGDVALDEVTFALGKRSFPLDLIAMTMDRSAAPTHAELLSPSQLLLGHHVRRVMRIDTTPRFGERLGTSPHLNLVRGFLSHLSVALACRVSNAYVAAVQAAQADAIKVDASPVDVWSSLTLMGNE